MYGESPPPPPIKKKKKNQIIDLDQIRWDVIEWYLHYNFDQYKNVDKSFSCTVYSTFLPELYVKGSGSHLQSQNVRLDKNNGM